MSTATVSTEEIECALSILQNEPSVSDETVTIIRELWRIFAPLKAKPLSALDTLANVASKGLRKEVSIRS